MLLQNGEKLQKLCLNQQADLLFLDPAVQSTQLS